MSLVSAVREQVIKRLTRSSGWSKVRRKFLKEHKECACCGRTYDLEVHHKKDFSNYPDLELDPNNLITLCGRCHLLFGHLNWWASINPTVVEDVETMKEKIENRRKRNAKDS